MTLNFGKQLFFLMTTAAFLIGNQMTAQAQSHSKNQRSEQMEDVLIKLAPNADFLSNNTLLSIKNEGGKVEVLTEDWVRIQTPVKNQKRIQSLLTSNDILYVQPNYKLYIPENHKINDPIRLKAIEKLENNQIQQGLLAPMAIVDNPIIPNPPQESTGNDPLFSHQWGMIDIGVQEAWKNIKRPSQDMIVAVIDTGVDYTHEDLLPNLWRNSKEIPNNGIDDDRNGYIDDIIGWDFFANDNKPFDMAFTKLSDIMKGGNAGHGTHCAGNVAAKSNNGKGIAGVAPNVKIMSLRFISEKGSGTSADAVKAIRYAVDNGAKVLSNSWGSEGEDPSEDTENKALREAIQYAQDKGVLFIAAAGNGHNGKGYDNDTDPKPSVPASYDYSNIISVAAIDRNDQLGSFSNWGLKTVHIGAPGVEVYSTMVDQRYSDLVIDKMGFQIPWNGTSMATPHVAGAAALYWSEHPEKNADEVKAAILGSAKKINALEGKTVTGGKLDVNALLKY